MNFFLVMYTNIIHFILFILRLLYNFINVVCSNKKIVITLGYRYAIFMNFFQYCQLCAIFISLNFHFFVFIEGF